MPWLTGQVRPLRCTLADYDRLAQSWIRELVLPRRHRTTQQFVGKACLLQEFPCVIQTAIFDHDAARQHAKRAFEHAHVPVQHHVRDVCALEQRLDRGDQHRIVGPDQFVHERLFQSLALEIMSRDAAALRPAPAAPDRPRA